MFIEAYNEGLSKFLIKSNFCTVHSAILIPFTSTGWWFETTLFFRSFGTLAAETELRHFLKLARPGDGSCVEKSVTNKNGGKLTD
jgi:hypothetical protein